MTRFLLDTTFIVDVLNDRRDRAPLLENLIAQQHSLACCAINVAEVYAGMHGSEKRETEELLRSLEYIPIRWETARLAGEIKQEWRRKGKTFMLTDTTIAAICILEKLTLITDNRKHFPMPELTLYPLP